MTSRIENILIQMDLLAEASNTYGIHSTTPDKIVRRPRATMNQTK